MQKLNNITNIGDNMINENPLQTYRTKIQDNNILIEV